MRTFVKSFLLGIFIFFGVSSFMFVNATVIKNDVGSSVNVNSFEMFWPLVAGKTSEDGFTYSLKLLKESLRGKLIFGEKEKMDYSIFVATKRILEGEYLINKGNLSAAEKAFMKAKKELLKAQNIFTKDPSSKPAFEAESVKRIENIIIFSNWLNNKNNKSVKTLEEIETVSKTLI